MSSFPDSRPLLRGKVDSPPAPFQEAPRWSLSVVLKYKSQLIGQWPAVQFTWLNCFAGPWPTQCIWCISIETGLISFLGVSIWESELWSANKLAGWNIGTFPEIPEKIANVPICRRYRSENIWKREVELRRWFDELFKSVLMCLCQFSRISAPPTGPEQTLYVLKKACFNWDVLFTFLFSWSSLVTPESTRSIPCFFSAPSKTPCTCSWI